MSIQSTIRDILSANPRLDGLFRRFVWSKIHFAEEELLFLHKLPARSVDIAIDVGAALGGYSWILNRKARQVFAFEPGDVHSHYLEVNFRNTNVTVVKAAVGDVAKTVDLYTAGSDTNALHMATLSLDNPMAHETGVTVSHVQQIALDDYFAAKIEAGHHVDVLKIDVEGYELSVFKGAQKLLNEHHPLIICEIESRLNPAYPQTFALLRSLGYNSYLFQNGSYRLFEGDAIREIQTAAALEERLSGHHTAAANEYLNNFVFQHADTRIKVA